MGKALRKCLDINQKLPLCIGKISEVSFLNR